MVKQLIVRPFSTETLGTVVNKIKAKAIMAGVEPNNQSVLCNVVMFLKSFCENKFGLKKGDEYELHLGESDIVGDLFYLRGKVGSSEFDHEFDGKAFRELGFTDNDMLGATMILAGTQTKEVAIYKVK